MLHDDHNPAAIPSHTPDEPSGPLGALDPSGGFDETKLDASRLVHELRNLLDGSLRNLEFVISDIQGADADVDDDTIRRLETVGAGLGRMGHLLHGWLSRRPATPAAAPAEHSLGEAVEHAIRLLGPAAEAGHIEISVTLDPNLAAQPAGPVYTVVSNAVRNSIQAIADAERSAGCIQVEGHRRGEYTVISVRDDGPGLPLDLFDERGIFRMGQTTRPDGYGLGLALCRAVAADLDGTLAVRNRHDEQGTIVGAEVTLAYPPMEDER